MKGVVLAMLVVLAVAHFMVKPGEGVGCGQVDLCLTECMSYLTTEGGSPSQKCCDGVRSLKTITPTVDDRRAACSCLKAAAANMPNIKQDSASSLPTACKVAMDIPISKTINCDTIN